MTIQDNTIIQPIPTDELLAEKERKWRLVLPADYRKKEEKKATITGIYISYAYSPMHLVVNRKLFVSVSPASKVII